MKASEATQVNITFGLGDSELEVGIAKLGEKWTNIKNSRCSPGSLLKEIAEILPAQFKTDPIGTLHGPMHYFEEGLKAILRQYPNSVGAIGLNDDNAATESGQRAVREAVLKIFGHIIDYGSKDGYLFSDFARDVLYAVKDWSNDIQKMFKPKAPAGDLEGGLLDAIKKFLDETSSSADFADFAGFMRCCASNHLSKASVGGAAGIEAMRKAKRCLEYAIAAEESQKS